MTVESGRLVVVDYKSDIGSNKGTHQYPSSAKRIVSREDEESFEGGGETESPYLHTYMMLGRLEMDNEYFLGAGKGNEKHLWAKDVDAQISEMEKLWNSLPDDGKPEWLSMEEIQEYGRKMKNHDGVPIYAGGGGIEGNYFEGDLAFLNW
jgi:hypothetical protein